VSEGVRTVAIVGDGLEGWTAAAVLARRLPPSRYQVRVIGCAVDPVVPALATLPSARGFHQTLGIDEPALLRASQGAWSLGVALTGWAEPGATRFLPFGAVGAPLGSVAFHQLLARLRHAGREVRAVDYSLPVIAAQAGRFAPPSSDGRSILSHYGAGLHLGVAGYRAAMRHVAEQRGARLIPAPFRDAPRAGDGSIAALTCVDGTRVEPLLALDCSGAQAVLARGTLGGEFDGWSDLLPCDRLTTDINADSVPPPPYSHCATWEAGWLTTVPLAGATARIGGWSSAFTEEEDVARRFGAGSVTVPFASGRLRAPWRFNCVAIGAAAGQVEPLHPVATHLVQSALARLVSLFPDAVAAPVEAAEYNRMTGNELDRARDFAAALYATGDRGDAPFWRAARPRDLPEPLARKLALFGHRGRLPMYDDEPFEEEDWVALFDAQGVRSRRYDAMADAIPLERVDAHLARLRETIIATVRTMPPHEEQLRRVYDAAPRGAVA
jgi:tryptophan halogenase